MKRMIPVIALAIVLASSSAWAADATAALDLNSAYVWRGMTANDGLVAQPSMNVAKNGFAFNTWANFDLSDYNDRLDKNNFSEVDLTLSYSHTFNKLAATAGVIEYLFPATAKTAVNGTRELFASLSHPIIGGLSAGVDFYYDVDENHGYYGDVGLTYSMDLVENLSLAASGKAGLASKEWAVYYGGEDGGWHDYILRLALTYALSKELSVGANINYADTLDKKVLPTEIAKTNLFGGVNVTYNF
ncbi:MAG: MltA-interacting MipA family protein [Desulfobacteraceae bacterium]|nr:MltA-interacting MipA family protein [Desulfobacteraceae bacterium]